MERSRNFYKTIRLGYILISVLIGCIAYNSFYEWQEIEALELLCCIPSKWTIIFDDLSHFAIFLSLLEHETPCKCPFGHLLSHIKQQTIGSNFY